MKNLEYIKALTDIDDEFVNEAEIAAKTVNITSKRKITPLVAAATIGLMLVACSILTATSEVFTDKSPRDEVNNRVEALTEQTTSEDFYDDYISRLAEIAAEYGIAEEDIVDKTYQEYIRNGYYFDEVILITKDTAIGRIITDAESFIFDVEFIGFFYNEKTDEFKTISQKTTAPGGKIEIIMNAERGWECFGGFLGRTQPESEYEDNIRGFYIQKYGIKPSVRAMQFMEKYYNEIFTTSGYRPVDEIIIDIATIKTNWIFEKDTGVFASTESDDPLDRIEQIASAFEMAGISNGTAFYDKQTVSDGQFIEIGYAYDKNRFIAFVNDTIEETTVEDWHLSMIFYNTEKDQYRVIKRSYSEFADFILPIETMDNWNFIGVYMYRSMPESDIYEFVDYCNFTPGEGDEADSQKFWERIQQEIESDKITTIQDHNDRLKRESRNK